jgi:hypothetical protein
MDSRPNYEMLQRYYQLPGENIMQQTNTFAGRCTNPKLFLLDRGGNCSFTKDLYEGFKDTGVECEKKKEFQFTPGERILSEDYFKGWNDSYFFQTNLFRNNKSLWHDPFRSNYFQGK